MKSATDDVDLAKQDAMDMIEKALNSTTTTTDHGVEGGASISVSESLNKLCERDIALKKEIAGLNDKNRIMVEKLNTLQKKYGDSMRNGKAMQKTIDQHSASIQKMNNNRGVTLSSSATPSLQLSERLDKKGTEKEGTDQSRKRVRKNTDQTLVKTIKKRKDQHKQ